MDDLADLERLAGSVLARLTVGERRKLLRDMARSLRASQSSRIGAQRNPDGSSFAARRPKKDETPGAYAVKFLYPKGAAMPRLVLMKSWVHQGPLITGYDIEAGGTRSFFWDKVAEWLPVSREEQNKSAGKLRRRGHIRRSAMFRKLRNSRNLQSGATEEELWVGFSGRVAAIARIHQEGLEDRPAPKAKPVRYAKRELLGLTAADRKLLLDSMLNHLTT